jgi:hypothetical protein
MSMERSEASQLPAGFHAQTIYEFRDPSGRFSYAFSNVYGPPRLGSRGPVCALDEDRSYWSVVGQTDDARKGQPLECSVSFAEARRAHRGRLSFARFASTMHMRRDLPTLL